MFERSRTEQIYDYIKVCADSNALIQGISGWAGFPCTLVVDGAVIFTHYARMLNKIRSMYERPAINEKEVVKLLPGLSEELLFDLIGDKILGNIPFVGIYFNAVCAKTLTWRLGILFAKLSMAGENISVEDASAVLATIREYFPHDDTFKFRQPSYDSFELMLQLADSPADSDLRERINSFFRKRSGTI